MNQTPINIHSEVNIDALILPPNLWISLDEIEGAEDKPPIVVDSEGTVVSGVSSYLLAIKEGKEKITVGIMSRFSKISVLELKAA